MIRKLHNDAKQEFLSNHFNCSFFSYSIVSRALRLYKRKKSILMRLITKRKKTCAIFLFQSELRGPISFCQILIFWLARIRLWLAIAALLFIIYLDRLIVLAIWLDRLIVLTVCFDASHNICFDDVSLDIKCVKVTHESKSVLIRFNTFFFYCWWCDSSL